jgi:hypothetical protein
MYKIINFEYNSEFFKNYNADIFLYNIYDVNDFDEIHNRNQIKEMDDLICLTKE